VDCQRWIVEVLRPEMLWSSEKVERSFRPPRPRGDVFVAPAPHNETSVASPHRRALLVHCPSSARPARAKANRTHAMQDALDAYSD
jgi:hypothetical protein